MQDRNYRIESEQANFVNLSWHNVEGTQLDFTKDAVLFTILVQAKAEVSISELFELNESRIAPEAYSNAEIYELIYKDQVIAKRMILLN